MTLNKTRGNMITGQLLMTLLSMISIISDLMKVCILKISDISIHPTGYDSSAKAVNNTLRQISISVSVLITIPLAILKNVLPII